MAQYSADQKMFLAGCIRELDATRGKLDKIVGFFNPSTGNREAQQWVSKVRDEVYNALQTIESDDSNVASPSSNSLTG